MKTALKILGVLCLVLVLLFGVSVFVVTRPSFQKRVVLSVLQEEGDEISLNYIKVGFSEGRVDGLSFNRPDLKVELDKADVHYSWTDALFRKTVRIDNLQIKGLVVDLRPTPKVPVAQPDKPSTPRPQAKVYTPERGPADPAPERKVDWDFSGVFPDEGLPIPVYLKQGNIEVTLLLPEERRADATITLNNIAPGSRGSADYTVKLLVPQPDAPPITLQSKGTLSVEQNVAGILQEIVLDLEMMAEGGPLKEQTVLHAEARAGRSGEDGERYRFSLSDAGGVKMINLDAVFENPEKGLVGELEVAVRDSQIKAFLMGFGAPAFSIEGSSNFSVIPKSKIARVKAAFHGKVSELQRVQADLANLGALDFSLKLKASLEKEKLRLDEVDSDLRQASGAPVLSLHALQAFEFDLLDPVDGLDDLSGELVRLELAGLPPAWIRPFLPDGLELNMDPLSGALVLSVPEEGKLLLTSPAPWVFSLQSLAWQEQPQLSALRLRLEPLVRWSEGMMELQLRNLFMDAQGVPLLSEGNVELKQAGEETWGRVRLKGDLAQLLQQPALQAYNNVARGVFQVQAEATLREQIRYQMKLALNELMQGNPPRSLGSLSVELKGDAAMDASSFSVQGPVRMVGLGGTSDLQLDLSMQRDQEKIRFKGDIRGPALFVDDFSELAKLFSAPSPASTATTATATTAPVKPATTSTTASKPVGTAAPTPSTEPVVDAVPVWHGLEGDVALTIDRVQLGNNRFDGVTTSLEVRDTYASLNGFKASFLKSPIQAQGRLTFDRTQPQKPYGLDGSFGVTDFNLGSFLTQGRPGVRAPMDGVFRGNGSLGGRGPSLGSLMDWAQGDFKLQGRDGRLSVLAAAGENVQKSGQVIGSILGVASLFAGDKVRELPVLNQLLGVLQEIPYNELLIDAKRGADLNINLSQFLMVGPELKLTGQGMVRYEPGKALTMQPLAIQTGLSAKGNTAKMLQELRLLGSQKDSQGYLSGFDFTITGTPSQPNFDELRERIVAAGTALLTQGLNNAPAEEQEKEKQDSRGENPLRNLFQRLNQ